MKLTNASTFKILFLTIGLFILGCTTIHLEKAERVNRRTPAEISSSKLTLENVEQLLNTHKPKSLEEALPLIPEECRSNVLLVYDSKSLQYADPSFPRVITYCDSAKAIFSFTSATDKPTSQNLEMIFFNENIEKPAFEWGRVEFSPESGNHKFEKNPKMCMGCHRTNFRPNWEGYAGWPGVYGGQSDIFYINKKSPEGNHYQAFLERIQDEPGRFAFIPNFSNWLKEWGSNQHQAENNVELRGVARFDVGNFTRLISRWNLTKVYYQLKTGNLPKFRYALMAALSQCGSLSTFFPLSLRNKFSETKIRAETENLYYKNRAEVFYRALPSRVGPNLLNFQLPDPTNTPNLYDIDYPYSAGLVWAKFFSRLAGGVRYVMTVAGQDIEDWTTGSSYRNYDFSDGADGYGFLLKKLLDSEPENLKAFYEIKSYSTNMKKYYFEHAEPKIPNEMKNYDFGLEPEKVMLNADVCLYLKEKSLKEFENSVK